MRPTVLRMKRTRDEESLGDFAMTEQDESLVGKMQAVALGGVAPQRRRVFRHVATVTEEEAQIILENPDMMEEFKKSRQDVKRATQATVESMKQRDRATQKNRVSEGRLRVLQERRSGNGASVMDVGRGKRARDEIEDTNARSNTEPSSGLLHVNGMPMKRVDLSLMPSDSAKGLLVDLFVEQTEETTSWYGGEDVANEIHLERFENDDENAADKLYHDDEDPDGCEIDYPSGSSSDDSQEEGEGYEWSRPGYDSENENDRYEHEEPDAFRPYDRSLYLEEDLGEDSWMPWNQNRNY